MRATHLVLVATALILAGGAGATTVKRVRLEEAVRVSAEIFVGTVISLEVVEGGPPRKLLFTEVTFGRLGIEKGRRSTKTLTYRFAGGTRGKTTIRVDGVPRFVEGRRYVLFANARLDRLCPLVGWWQGCYVVGKDARTGEDILCDAAGRPVFDFADGRPVTRPPSPHARPIRLTAFLERVREILRKQETKEREADEGRKP